MSKLLIEVYLPAINQSYDVYIPLTGKIYEIEVLLASAFMELSDGYFIASNESVICDRASGNVLDINLSAAELGLHHGSKLMLI